MFRAPKLALRWGVFPLVLCISSCRCVHDNHSRGCDSSRVEVAGHARVETECGESEPPQPRLIRFGLLGPLFSYERLYEGTAFFPWQYVFNVGLSASQCLNTVLGGDPDESLSSRIGRSDQAGHWPAHYGLAPAVDLLIGPDHCEQCIEHEEPCSKELWAW